MKKNNKWESLVWILMWIFILWLVLLWISNIVITSRSLNENEINESSLSILKNNSMSILNKANLNNINLLEEFYIEKDKSSEKIYILTWTTNSWSMYIDRHWYKINNILTFKWYKYTQIWKVISIDNELWFKNIIFELEIEKY